MTPFRLGAVRGVSRCECSMQNSAQETTPSLLRDWSDGTPDVSAAYDDAGRVLTLASSTGTVAFGYNDANDLVSETQDIQSPVNLPPKTLGCSYDADGNRTGGGRRGSITGRAARASRGSTTRTTPPTSLRR